MAPSTASFVSGSSDLHTGAGIPPARFAPPRRHDSTAVAAGLYVPAASPFGFIVIRRSEVIDLPKLRRLAALNSRKLPKGTFLLAEIGGDMIAASPLETSEPALGDHFRSTAAGRHLLDRQARSHRQELWRSPINAGEVATKVDVDELLDAF
jgi:hypothetical protein